MDLDVSAFQFFVKSLLLNDTIEKAKDWFLGPLLASSLKQDGGENIGETAGQAEVEVLILKANDIDAMSELYPRRSAEGPRRGGDDLRLQQGERRALRGPPV